MTFLHISEADKAAVVPIYSLKKIPTFELSSKLEKERAMHERFITSRCSSARAQHPPSTVGPHSSVRYEAN